MFSVHLLVCLLYIPDEKSLIVTGVTLPVSSHKKAATTESQQMYLWNAILSTLPVFVYKALALPTAPTHAAFLKKIIE